MTDIETLLSVDAGHTPKGVVAFFLDDPDLRFRRLLTVLAVLTALGALGGVIGGGGRIPVSLALLGAGLLAVGGMRTIRDDENPAFKRKVLVVTSSGIIVRDTHGLRNWGFEDLSDVVAGISDSRPYLALIDRRGIHHTFQCRGERARKIISSRLRLRQPNLG